MKIQNNVNYNSSPAFGTRLVVKGETARDFANALRGGFIALGKEKEVKVIKHKDEFFILTGATDIRGFKMASRIARKAKTSLDNLLKVFFEPADRVDLTEPQRFILEGISNVAESFADALAGGFNAQRVPLGRTTYVSRITHEASSNTHEVSSNTFLAIGDESRLLRDATDTWADAKDGTTHKSMTDNFFKDAQKIHVTE